MAFKFLHCGDLHLGCMPNHIEERYEDFFNSFKALIDNAYEENVKYLLIAGDIFHVKNNNSNTLLSVTNIFDYAKSKGLKVIAIEGNHDNKFYGEKYSWLEFLANRGFLTLLKHKIVDNELVLDENSIYEDENIRVIGIGYLGALTNEYLKGLENKIEKKDKYTVLMLHCAIDRFKGQDMGYVPKDDLLPLKDKVNYIALGHIHTKYEANDFCYNPGSLENVRITDAEEKNVKGYYIVEVNNLEDNVKHFVSKQRRVDFKILTLNKDMSLDEATEYLSNYNYNVKENEMLYVEVNGEVEFESFLIKFEEIKSRIIERTHALYVEFNNKINLSGIEKTYDDISNIEDIETEAIKDYLTINCPDIVEKDDCIEELQTLKKMLTEDNKKEYDEIVNTFIKEVK